MDNADQSNTVLLDLVDVCRGLQERSEQLERRIAALEEKHEALTNSLGRDHIVVAQRTQDRILWGWTAILAVAWREFETSNPGAVHIAGPMTREAAEVLAEQLKHNLRLLDTSADI